jgi:hypothetical protein
MLPRPSERIRRSLIVPIQLGGSFLISLTSPLVGFASRVFHKKRGDDWVMPPDAVKPHESHQAPPTGKSH